MSVLLGAVALASLAAGWVVVPLIARRLAAFGDPVPGGVLDAQARRQVALASLKEIEYDRIGGKLDDADYAHLRAQLEREALWAIEAAESVAGGDESLRTRPITHACGFTNPAGSRFCSGCGAALAARA